MVKIIFIASVLFLFYSCAPKKYMEADCNKFQSIKLLPKVRELVLNEKMEIMEYDSTEGYLKARLTQKIITPKGGDNDNYWEIFINEGTLKAKAWVVMNIPEHDVTTATLPLNRDAYNDMKRRYLFDMNQLDYSWYNNVKAGLEYICGDTLKRR